MTVRLPLAFPHLVDCYHRGAPSRCVHATCRYRPGNGRAGCTVPLMRRSRGYRAIARIEGVSHTQVQLVEARALQKLKVRWPQLAAMLSQ